jgi:hypothetical protein
LIILDGLEKIIPNMAEKLLDNQVLLKCIYYNSSDALSQPDLTEDQRYELIDQDLANISTTRIFFSPAPQNIVLEEQAQFRLYIDKIIPDNVKLAKVIYDFQVIVHEDLWPLNGGKQRPLVMIQEILKILNGTDVDGMGSLYLQFPISVIIYDNKFSGYMLSLQNWSD